MTSKLTILTSFIALTALSPVLAQDLSGLGVSATSTALDQYSNIKMPEADTDGKIPTLNKTGLMTHDRDPFSEAFIEYASTCEHPVLEIGSAYGISTLPTLEKGATVVANDIEPRHLYILRNQTPENLRSQLYLNPTEFPRDSEFPPNSFDAILICRVAHLLTPEQMEQGLDKIYTWLRPGGRIYITSMTPFHHGLKEFLPTYEERIEEGEDWPGVITNFHDYFPKIKEWSPEYAHVMDERPLLKALEKRGFEIVESKYYDYDRPNKSNRTGREYYGVVAAKGQHRA